MKYVIATYRTGSEIHARQPENKTRHSFHPNTRKDEVAPERMRPISLSYIFFPQRSSIYQEEIDLPLEFQP